MEFWSTINFWRILFLAMHLLPKGSVALSLDPEMSRRSALQQSFTSASVFAGGIASGFFIDPAAHATPDLSSELPSMASAYQVFPDATPARNPKIKSVAVSLRFRQSILSQPFSFVRTFQILVSVSIPHVCNTNVWLLPSNPGR